MPDVQSQREGSTGAARGEARGRGNSTSSPAVSCVAASPSLFASRDQEPFDPKTLQPIPFVANVIANLPIRCLHHPPAMASDEKDQGDLVIVANPSAAAASSESLASSASSTSATRRDAGCPWTGTLGKDDRNWLQHQAECAYEFVPCPECGDALRRRQLEQHRAEACRNRSVACAFCPASFQQHALADHLSEAPCKNSTRCANGCLDPATKSTLVLSRSAADAHALVCTKRLVPCLVCVDAHAVPLDELQLHYDVQLIDDREAFTARLVDRSMEHAALREEVKKVSQSGHEPAHVRVHSRLFWT